MVFLREDRISDLLGSVAIRRVREGPSLFALTNLYLLFSCSPMTPRPQLASLALAQNCLTFCASR